MWKIIAIGGWKIWQPKEDGWFHPIETTKIDKEIVKQTWKDNPKLLFIPTASYDSITYSETIKKHFWKLWCKTDVLYLIKENPSKKHIEEKILWTDIIYVWWGNTLKMMTIWRKLWIDKILEKAYKKNIVLSWLSAGSICWFKYGNSDSRKFTSWSKQLIKVSWLWFINALHCPHYDTEILRESDLKRMIKRIPKIVAIALDECCALEVIDEKYKIIKSKPTTKAYKIYYKKWKYHKEEIITPEFQKLNILLQK